MKAKEIIAYNIPFDRRFIEYHLKVRLRNKEKFCTMRATQYLYDAPHMKNGEPKYPKLSEAVEWAGIDTQKIIRQREGVS